MSKLESNIELEAAAFRRLLAHLDERKDAQNIDLFKTRSMSGFVIGLQGPLHWRAKRQSITARSSAEAEIYATDECVKSVLHLTNIIKDLELQKEILSETTTIYNDNMATIHWSKNQTSKNIRHLQIRENAVRESVQDKTVTIKHIDGKTNLADIFTKEDKDLSHFIAIRDVILSRPFPPSVVTNNSFTKLDTLRGV